MLRGSTHGSSSSALPPLSSWSDGVPAIFLSHSGKQKAFVENLFNALQRANRSVFFDADTLPKAEKYPANIKAAAEGCEVGVVVLSEDFLVSRWPMVELEILVLERGPRAKVLPLFYKLSPGDLKNTENLSRWRQAWEKLNVAPDVVVKWKKALRTVRAFNGEVFTDGSSEYSYIKTVVRNLCKQVPASLLEDLSPIRGLDRLAEEVAGYFDDARQCDDKALLVGLHGVGGLGKTTVCRIMVNSFSTEYLGRCYHLEFPTTFSEPQIVQECKNALEQLTDLSDELLTKANKFDQVIELMKRHLGQLDVFLAIDNVWEDSSEAAKRILQVGLSANSKILLTSRSEQILKDLLGAHSNVCVRPLPGISYDEAFQIFQDAFGEYGSDREQVDRMIRRFLFHGVYHALALKEFGRYVRKGCMPEASKKNEEFLSEVIKEIKNKDLETLEKVIRIRYDALPRNKKQMFLDIAVMISIWSFGYDQVMHAKLNQWLRLLCKDDESGKTRIETIIYELAQDALVQLETDSTRTITSVSWGQKWRERRGAVRTVRMHDLYSDLARREALATSRFFICDGKSKKPLDQIEWENLETVVLGPGENTTPFIEKAQRQECKKLQVLCATDGVDLLSGIDMRRMPSLRILYLSNVTLRRIENWSAAPRLGLVFLSDIRGGGEPYDKVITITENRSAVPKWGVCFSWLTGCIPLFSWLISRGAGPPYDHISGAVGESSSSSSMRVLRLDALIQLQALHLDRCHDLERIQGLGSLENLETLSVRDCQCLEDLDGLGALPRLKALHVEKCEKVKRLPDLSGLTCLEELVLDDNENMEELEGASPPALSSICISACSALKSTPDLSGSTVLESLKLYRNSSMKEVQGVVSSSLTDLAVQECSALKIQMVDLSSFTHLDVLILENVVMEELGAVGFSVRVMRIADCKALKRVPDLSGLTRLAVLELHSNQEMEEVGCLPSTLQEISIVSCMALTKTPNLSRLTRLHQLQLCGNELLKTVGSLSSSVKDLQVSECKALETIPYISGLTCLQSLRLNSNDSMWNVRGQYVSGTLKILSITYCRRMRSFPSLKDCVQLREVAVTPDTIAVVALSDPPNLCKLELRGGKRLPRREQWDSFTLLKELTVLGCEASRVDLASLSPLVSLKSLKLHSCLSLKEIANPGKLQGLERLQLDGCPSLEKLEGFDKGHVQILVGSGFKGAANLQRFMSDKGDANFQHSMSDEGVQSSVREGGIEIAGF